MRFQSDRRKLLKFGVGAAAGALTLGGSLARAFSATGACLGETPAQTAGPFYPGEKEFSADSILTVSDGHLLKTLGQVVYIQGTVTDLQCHALPRATVEIWQACASGRYNNATDTNSAPLDPNFKYWGESVTDANGNYTFKTIIPGAYPADTDWMRPPHIHFKVSHLGYEELITQMYFRGQPLNEKDLILDKVPHDQWDRVIVDFTPASKDLEPGALFGTFNINLKSIR